MTSSAAPQVGDLWVNAELSTWSPWRMVTVQDVDLLGYVRAVAADGRTHCFAPAIFKLDYRPSRDKA